MTPSLSRSVTLRIRILFVVRVVVGDGVAAGAGVMFQISIRIFKSSPSRITDRYPLISLGPLFSFFWAKVSCHGVAQQYGDVEATHVRDDRPFACRMLRTRLYAARATSTASVRGIELPKPA
jgi:hypothetical protein